MTKKKKKNIFKRSLNFNMFFKKNISMLHWSEKILSFKNLLEIYFICLIWMWRALNTAEIQLDSNAHNTSDMKETNYYLFSHQGHYEILLNAIELKSSSSCFITNQIWCFKSNSVLIMLWIFYFGSRQVGSDDILSCVSELCASLNARMINFEHSISAFAGCFVVLNMDGKNSYSHVKSGFSELCWIMYRVKKYSQKHLASTQHWNGC